MKQPEFRHFDPKTFARLMVGTSTGRAHILLHLSPIIRRWRENCFSAKCRTTPGSANGHPAPPGGVAVMVPTHTTLISQARDFSHDEADRLARLATTRTTSPQVVIDLSRVADATTSAFARLVVLRRTLLRSGRDLRLAGLHDRAQGLYEVIRLDAVLPRV
jgi:ABC-type transporter Mla MlaB component